MRRDLHMHPELSGHETSTTLWIEQHLRDLGLAPVRLAVGTGLVCDLPLGSPGPGSPVVALRADIDALAMPDEKDVGYRSQAPGVAHACGHDVHTTAVLGAARALHAVGRDAGVTGTVRLVFEPSEESVPGGAVDVLREGHLDGVGAIFGVHCDPRVDVGRVGTRVGPLSSAADMVEISVRGPGGHTARPDRTVDLAALLGRLLTGVQPAVDARTGSPGALRVVFGAVHAGDAANVIPSSGVLRGTLRTPHPEVWRDTPALLRAAVGELLDGSGAEWDIAHRRGVPPVVNDPGMTAVLDAAVRDALGDDGLVGTDQSWGGDSFAWYLERVPGSYARLGVHDPESGKPRLDLHASTFDVDERAIRCGASVLATAAVDALRALSR
ncbi:MAG: amidohydrolase [Frankiales bacterium]|nr:amidohydrolase [Frankiales bacterium]